MVKKFLSARLCGLFGEGRRWGRVRAWRRGRWSSDGGVRAGSRAAARLALLSAAVEHARDGIFVMCVDPSGTARFKFVNGGFLEISGLAREQLLGWGPEKLGISLDTDATDVAWTQVLRSRLPCERKVTARRPDGKESTLEIRLIPVDLSHDAGRDWVGVLRDTHDATPWQAALQDQSLQDPVTGLPNREFLVHRLTQTLALGALDGSVPALLVVSLDGFKEINDSCGHECGDLLLSQIGHRLQRELRSADTIVRVGGDEFGVLLPGIAGEIAAVGVARKLLAALTEPFRVGVQSIEVAASIGISLPSVGADTATLLRRADIAAGQARRRGSGIQLYSAADASHEVDRVTTAGRLHEAIDAGELRLFYQPEVEIQTGRVCRLEGLIRWQHPERGLLAPDAFIPAAERSDTIVRLMGWVLDTGLSDCRRWLDEGVPVGISLNLSSRCLREERLPTVIAQALTRWEVAPSMLTLEVTESAIIADLDIAATTFRDLRETGVRIAVDDYGTGYSSLAYLKHLPIDEIKVDRSFIANMTTRREDAAIVRSTITLAHELGQAIVAEGVEDAATWSALRIIGCDFGQGFHICRPSALDEMLVWIADRGRRAGETRRADSEVSDPRRYFRVNGS